MMRDFQRGDRAGPDEFAGVQSMALTTLVQDQLPNHQLPHFLPWELYLVSTPVTLLFCVSGLRAWGWIFFCWE